MKPLRIEPNPRREISELGKAMEREDLDGTRPLRGLIDKAVGVPRIIVLGN
jgi:hypothetical protein